MKILPLPPLELLQERYYIAEDSPSGLRNKIDINYNALKDDVAGYKHKRGYYHIEIQRKKYKAHLK